MTATTSLSAAPLWIRTRALFARAIAAFGGAIAAIALLSRAQRHEIMGWLASLEHIVRKLLLAEAAKLQHAPTAPGWTAGLPARIQSAQRAARSKSARLKLDLSRPETWRANFSLSPPRDVVPNARAPRIRALWGPTAIAAPAENLRLAQRFEAIRRVLENPLPHAKRLARLLARAVRRFPEIVMRYASMPARAPSADRVDLRLSVEAISAALIAAHAFPDSS